MLEVYLTGVAIWIFQEFNHNWMDTTPDRESVIWGILCAVLWPAALMILGIGMIAVLIERVRKRWE